MRLIKNQLIVVPFCCLILTILSVAAFLVSLMFRGAINPSLSLPAQNDTQFAAIEDINTAITVSAYSFVIFATGTIISLFLVLFPTSHPCDNKKARYNRARLKSHADREEKELEEEELDEFDDALDDVKPSGPGPVNTSPIVSSTVPVLGPTNTSASISSGPQPKSLTTIFPKT